MWSLIKMEYAYTRTGLAVYAMITTGLWIFAVVQEGWDLGFFMRNTGIILIATVGIVGSQIDSEKRDRIYTGLPVPIRVISIVRTAYIGMMLVALMGVWTAFMLLSPQGASWASVFSIITSACLVMIGYSIFALSHDFGFYGTYKYRWILWGVVTISLAVAIVMLIEGAFEPMWLDYSAFLKTFNGVLVHVPLGIVAGLCTMQVFVRRRSFLK